MPRVLRSGPPRVFCSRVARPERAEGAGSELDQPNVPASRESSAEQDAAWQLAEELSGHFAELLGQ
jgi:hypothetical protein